MASSGRTNQTLYFAQLALKDGAVAAEQGDRAGQRRHEEAALFHTHVGLVSFCAELVAQYRLSPFQTLTELFARDGLPAELAELVLLSKDSQGWLGQLLITQQRVLIQGLEVSKAQEGLIASQSDYLALIRNWLIELEKLVMRHREHYVEC